MEVVVVICVDLVVARKTEVHKNVAKVLTSYTGVWTDELIMSEIE